MILLELERPLSTLVESKYQSAKASQSISVASSSLSIIHTKSGYPFQLRYCPSLAKKPTSQKEGTASNKSRVKRYNPFETPEDALFIANVPTSENPSHVIVLNKFPIIAEHFILATKTEKPQAALLEEDDLAVAHACLEDWEASGKGKRLFAFFNSGEHSGASQAHRHLQFLPVESMRGDVDTKEWDVLMENIGRAGGSSNLPFTYFWQKLSKDTSPSNLLSIYKTLYAQTLEAVKCYCQSHPEHKDILKNVSQSPAFSYNLGMTSSAMMMAPRRKEGDTILHEDGSQIGFVAFNGTLLAGTLMVKREAEWEWLQSRPDALDQALAAALIPRDDIRGASM